jgi:hypothetical protein
MPETGRRYTPVRRNGETIMREYVVWGVPPGGDAETVLYTRAATLADARRVADALEARHGCTRTRIQTLDMSATGESIAGAFRAAVAR